VKLLEQPYVEDVVDAGARRQGEPNRDLIYHLDHAMRPKVAGLELAAARRRDGRRRALV
jgi:hypothetical protein